MSARVIDAHHHFWRYTTGEFGWIDDSMACIRRDFLPENLEDVISGAGVDRVVTVQARPLLEETFWLLQMAETHPWIAGVVGWVPLSEPTVAETLEQLVAAQPKLRGVREVMQGMPPGALLEARFNQGVAVLGKLGLAYDLLIFENQIAEAIKFADLHPGQTIVVDHLAKPRIRYGCRQEWEKGLRELARRPNVSCKISGMVSEADFWSAQSLRPYFETAVEAFTPSRLLFGSDWPVSLVKVGYSRWLQVVRDWTGGWSKSERDSLFGATAERAYRLGKNP